jgi:hypothetical protein
MSIARRVAFALLAAILLAAAGSRAASTTDYSDQWWSETESGWGASVLQEADVLFVDLFVYDSNRQPTWFTAAASLQPSAPAGHTVFSGDLYSSTGPYYGAGSFDARQVTRAVVGTLTFDATSVNAATLSYTVKGAAVVKSVTRQTWRAENLNGSYRGAQSGQQNSCGVDNGKAETLAVIDVSHAAGNAITVKFTDSQGRVRTVSGTYTASGHLGRVVGTITDTARGWTGTAELSAIESTPAGITGSGHLVFQQSGATVCVWDGQWGGARRTVGTSSLKGTVLDGRIQAALVCIDANRNGRCDTGETQARSDAAGGFAFALPVEMTAPLVAEVVAGVARDSAQPGTTVDVSYRLASPSSAYSTNITPLTTLVHLTGLSNYPLAEDLVRNEVGLPPRYDLLPAVAPAAGSLTRAVEDSVVVALKATSATLDMSSSRALATVVAAFPPALTTLPKLTIATRAGAPITSKEVYIDATFVLANPMVGNATVMLNGQIRGRGNTTWGWPKNPYHVKLVQDAAYAGASDLLGMKMSRHWALLADYFDRSLIRNKLALSLGSSAVFRDGLKWNPSGQHVEVWLNDEYVGVYLLTEMIRIEPNRLDIRVMSGDPAVGEIDGGYVLEVDTRLDCYNQGTMNLQHVTPQGVPVCVARPDEGDITLQQLAYAKNMVDAAETSIYAGGVELINLASFVDFYLLSELVRNNDAQFYSSDYLWKDSATSAVAADRLLNMGPLWDFDLSSGNINYNNNWLTEGCWVLKPDRPNWFAKLALNPQFVQLAVDRWKAKRSALEKFVNASIDTYARRLDGAQQRNFAKWPIFGVPLTQHYSFATYGEEVAFVKQFLNDRMLWMDKAFATPAAFATMCR